MSFPAGATAGISLRTIRRVSVALPSGKWNTGIVEIRLRLFVQRRQIHAAEARQIADARIAARRAVDAHRPKSLVVCWK